MKNYSNLFLLILLVLSSFSIKPNESTFVIFNNEKYRIKLFSNGIAHFSKNGCIGEMQICSYIIGPDSSEIEIWPFIQQEKGFYKISKKNISKKDSGYIEIYNHCKFTVLIGKNDNWNELPKYSKLGYSDTIILFSNRIGKNVIELNHKYNYIELFETKRKSQRSQIIKPIISEPLKCIYENSKLIIILNNEKLIFNRE